MLLPVLGSARFPGCPIVGAAVREAGAASPPALLLSAPAQLTAGGDLALGPSRSDGGSALVRPAHAGRTELPTGATGVGPGGLHGARGSGHPAALGPGVLRLFVLLAGLIQPAGRHGGGDVPVCTSVSCGDALPATEAAAAVAATTCPATGAGESAGGVLAPGPAIGAKLAGPLGVSVALPARVAQCAPTARASGTPGCGRKRTTISPSGPPTSTHYR